VREVTVCRFPPSLQRVRQEYLEVESAHAERRGTYDKIAVGLELEKKALEKECDSLQVMWLGWDEVGGRHY